METLVEFNMNLLMNYIQDTFHHMPVKVHFKAFCYMVSPPCGLQDEHLN